MRPQARLRTGALVVGEGGGGVGCGDEGRGERESGGEGGERVG